MSHVTDIRLKVRDLASLKDACAELGLEFRENQKTFAWWGSYAGDSHDYGEITPDRMGRCEHAIRIPGDRPANGSSGPWEIGVVKAKDGDGFAVGFDAYGSAGARLTNKVGVGGARLKQEYATAFAMRRGEEELGRKGFAAVRENQPDGRVLVRLRTR